MSGLDTTDGVMTAATTGVAMIGAIAIDVAGIDGIQASVAVPGIAATVGAAVLWIKARRPLSSLTRRLVRSRSRSALTL